MPDRPDFSPDELAALFGLKDGLLHGLMLPRIPGSVLTLTASALHAQALLSALDKLLED